MAEFLWRIELPYAVAGIIVVDNRVIESAPIFAWMVGKTLAECEAWVLRMGGKMEQRRWDQSPPIS
jgi:hypothetical protein